MFQSSPGLSTGRYLAFIRFLRGKSGFNPRPAFRPDATWPRPAACIAGRRVSILARPFDRTLPWFAWSNGSEHSFQSSPGLSTGRYHKAARWRRGKRVSILARPFDRTLRRRRRQQIQQKQFQSSPGLSTGRYLSMAQTRMTQDGFQSSPGLSTGRYTGRQERIIAAVEFQSSPGLSTGRYAPAGRSPGRRNFRFNPRPAFRPDATLRNTKFVIGPRCFNPRPAFRPDATCRPR